MEAAGSRSDRGGGGVSGSLSSGEGPTVEGPSSGESSSGGSVRVFINHRRDDSATAQRLHRLLAHRFGTENVFLDDLRTRVRGVDWLEQMQARTVGSLVFLALIGPEWLASLRRHYQAVEPGRDGALREIEVAVRARARTTVIPVLIDDAVMPREDELPRSIRPLVSVQGAWLRSMRFDEDVEHLIAAIETRAADPGDVPAMGEAEPPPWAAADRPPMAPPVGGPHAQDVPRLVRQAARGGVVLVGSREGERGRGITSPEVVGRSPAPAPTPSARNTEADAWGGQDEAAHEPPGVQPAPSPSPTAARAPAPQAARHGSTARRSAFWLLAGAATLAVIKWITGFPFAADDAHRVGSPEDDEVECTVFACRSLRRAEPSLVQVFLHPRADAAYATARAQEADPGTEVRIARCLDCSVAPGARVRVELRVPGAHVEQPVETIVWRGRPDAAQFEVVVNDPAITGVVATVLIAVGDEPVGRLKFKLAVGEAAPAAREPVGDSARNYRAAFISYASEDRDKVLLWRRMARRFDLKAFQDRLDLEPGQRWVEAVERAIDDSDLFVLFWSHDAERSTWVRREVQHALQHQRLDEEELPEIWPVILDGPPPATPWQELSHLHFDDPLLYFADVWDLRPAASMGMTAEVRFDGIYVQPSEGAMDLIRFFAPNTAVVVTVGTDEGESLAELLPQVARWLGPGRDHGDGVFEIDGERIAWDSVSSHGTVRYRGTIGAAGAELRLHTHSLINGHKSVGVWRFAGLEGG